MGIYLHGFKIAHPDQVTQELRDIFQTFGAIKSIDVPRMTKDVSWGFAFIHFEDNTCDEKALTLDGQTINGAKLKVAKARKRRVPKIYDAYDDADTIYPWTR